MEMILVSHSFLFKHPEFTNFRFTHMIRFAIIMPCEEFKQVSLEHCSKSVGCILEFVTL